MNLFCYECQKHTKNSGNIKMIHKAGKIIKIYLYCIDCGLINTKIIYEKDLNYYSYKLGAKI